MGGTFLQRVIPFSWINRLTNHHTNAFEATVHQFIHDAHNEVYLRFWLNAICKKNEKEFLPDPVSFLKHVTNTVVFEPSDGLVWKHWKVRVLHYSHSGGF
jgi:hypothetical protein